jgi:hypothetical protein
MRLLGLTLCCAVLRGGSTQVSAARARKEEEGLAGGKKLRTLMKDFQTHVVGAKTT